MQIIMINTGMNCIFQAYLTTAYSTITHLPDIKTLEELDQSGLRIATKNDDIFGINNTGVAKRLSDRIDYNHHESMDTAAAKRHVIVVQVKLDAQLLIRLNYSYSDGEPMLHIVEECPRSYHSSYLTYKGYPFFDRINKFFQATVEAGLNYKWYYDTQFSLLLKIRQSESDNEITKMLSLKDFQTAFILLVHGLLLSIVVFCCEYTYIRLKRKLERNKSLKVYKKNLRKV